MPSNVDAAWLIEGPKRASITVALTHGAGAAMDTPFLSFFAQGLAKAGMRVVRFEFPYMAERRRIGRVRPPDREAVLRTTWLGVISAFDPTKLVIGGKSMGGRIASLVGDDAGVMGLVCLGYPFHPTGKRDQLRTEHLKTIRTPTLILQGERDPFGNQLDVSGYELSDQIQVCWLADGDHSFKPRKSSGGTEQGNWQEGVDRICDFVRKLATGSSR